MADTDLEQIKDDLSKVDEAISGKDGLLVRTAVAETRMESMADKLDEQGGEIKALRGDLTSHIGASQLQHAALKSSVDNVTAVLGNLATKDDLKSLTKQVDEVAKCEEEEAAAEKSGVIKYLNADNAKTIGTVLGTAIVTALGYWGFSLAAGPATAGTVPVQQHPTEQHVAVPASQLPKEDGPEGAP